MKDRKSEKDANEWLLEALNEPQKRSEPTPVPKPKRKSYWLSCAAYALLCLSMWALLWLVFGVWVLWSLGH